MARIAMETITVSIELCNGPVSVCRIRYGGKRTEAEQLAIVKDAINAIAKDSAGGAGKWIRARCFAGELPAAWDRCIGTIDNPDVRVS